MKRVLFVCHGRNYAARYQTTSELMLFQNSFKLGARLAIEVMME